MKICPQRPVCLLILLILALCHPIPCLAQGGSMAFEGTVKTEVSVEGEPLLGLDGNVSFEIGPSGRVTGEIWQNVPPGPREAEIRGGMIEGTYDADTGKIEANTKIDIAIGVASMLGVDPQTDMAAPTLTLSGRWTGSVTPEGAAKGTATLSEELLSMTVQWQAQGPDMTAPAGPEEPLLSDRDRDGIPDDQDACPDQYAPTAWDGCPQAQEPEEDEPLTEDTDRDGIPDEQDVCPNQYAPDTWDGCPPPTPTLTLEEHIVQWTLFGTGRLEDIEGWERLSPTQQDNLRRLAEALGVLKEKSQAPAQSPGGAGQAAVSPASQATGADQGFSGGNTQSQAKQPDDAGEPKPPAVYLSEVERALQKKLAENKDVMREFHKEKYGETAYKALRLWDNIVKPVYKKAGEWSGVVENPRGTLWQKYQVLLQEKGREGAQQFLRQEGFLPKDAPPTVSEAEFAQAVFDWAQATTEAVVPIHYDYYRRQYEANLEAEKMRQPRDLQDQWQPSEPDKQMAHSMAMDRLRDRLKNPGDEDISSRDYGELGATGNIGRAWGPQHSHNIKYYNKAFARAYGWHGQSNWQIENTDQIEDIEE